MPPELIIPGAPPQPLAYENATVVDPTTIGRRYRRSSHHLIYRWTQGCSMLGALLAAISVICTMADDIILSRSLAVPGLVLGGISIVLSARNGLAGHWRGWTIAATAFSAVGLS